MASPPQHSHRPASKPSTGLTGLYANLLDPQTTAATTAAATISRDPVPAPSAEPADEAATAKSKATAPFRFQPVKRAPLANAKPKPFIAKAALQAVNPTAGTDSVSSNSTAAAVSATGKAADWAATLSDDDANAFYQEKRQRGGRKKKKRKDQGGYEPVPLNWDDIYDPTRPNNYEEYKDSEEKFREIREWKDVLYAHRRRRRYSSSRSRSSSREGSRNAQFAPPSAYNFAPPSEHDQPVATATRSPAALPDDPTGDDAYARRLRIGQIQVQSQAHRYMPQPPGPNDLPVPLLGFFPGQIPPPPAQMFDQVPPPPISAPTYSATISRAPMLHFPPPPPDMPTEDDLMEEDVDMALQPEEDAPRSLRPGQKDFASRLMAKYGWSKGQGLGATGSGIAAPLRVQAEKQTKPQQQQPSSSYGLRGEDEDGINRLASTKRANMGKIIAPKQLQQAQSAAESTSSQQLSHVIRLKGMLGNILLNPANSNHDISELKSELLQEIGDECSSKYGRVERVLIPDIGSGTGSDGQESVFVKFTSELSALRAVTALQGRMYAGNTIEAEYFDEAKFENGEFGL